MIKFNLFLLAVFVISVSSLNLRSDHKYTKALKKVSSSSQDYDARVLRSLIKSLDDLAKGGPNSNFILNAYAVFDTVKDGGISQAEANAFWDKQADNWKFDRQEIKSNVASFAQKDGNKNNLLNQAEFGGYILDSARLLSQYIQKKYKYILDPDTTE